MAGFGLVAVFCFCKDGVCIASVSGSALLAEDGVHVASLTLKSTEDLGSVVGIVVDNDVGLPVSQRLEGRGQ